MTDETTRPPFLLLRPLDPNTAPQYGDAPVAFEIVLGVLPDNIVAVVLDQMEPIEGIAHTMAAGPDLYTALYDAEVLLTTVLDTTIIERLNRSEEIISEKMIDQLRFTRDTARAALAAARGGQP